MCECYNIFTTWESYEILWGPSTLMFQTHSWLISKLFCLLVAVLISFALLLDALQSAHQHQPSLFIIKNVWCDFLQLENILYWVRAYHIQVFSLLLILAVLEEDNTFDASSLFRRFEESRRLNIFLLPMWSIKLLFRAFMIVKWEVENGDGKLRNWWSLLASPFLWS